MHLPFLYTLWTALWLSWGPEASPQAQRSQSALAPKKVILLIGDGMGLAQLSSALFYGEKEPNFLRFPVTGLSKTSSASHKITDSAAGATAFSTGKKTYNGAIAVDQDSLLLNTILEDLSTQGYRSGLVATSSITHATPASFYAHTDSRKKEFSIAEQLLGSSVDFFAGGGKNFFFKRLDNKNLYPEFARQNIVLDTIALTKRQWDKEKRYGYLLAGGGLAKKMEGRGDFLPQATKMALDYLDHSAAPFFLMVEGSQIDWGGHANDGEYLYTEMLDFDAAIGAALDYAEQDGETLVIVTADHECGGFAMVAEEVEVPFRGKQRDYDSLRMAFSSGGHSATMVPVLAYGPGSERFTGIYENTAIYDKIKACLVH